MKKMYIIVLIAITLFSAGCASKEQSIQENDLDQDVNLQSIEEKESGERSGGENQDDKRPEGAPERASGGNGERFFENLPDKDSLNLEALTDEEIELIDKLYNEEIDFRVFNETFPREKMNEIGLRVGRYSSEKDSVETKVE